MIEEKFGSGFDNEKHQGDCPGIVHVQEETNFKNEEISVLKEMLFEAEGRAMKWHKLFETERKRAKALVDALQDIENYSTSAVVRKDCHAAIAAYRDGE